MSTCPDCTRLAVKVGWARDDLGNSRRTLAHTVDAAKVEEGARRVADHKAVLARHVATFEEHQAGCDWAARRAGQLAPEDVDVVVERRAAGEKVRDLALVYGLSETAMAARTHDARPRFIRQDEPWMADALCAEMGDPDSFFPEAGAGVAFAKQVCGSCDVREACLEYALRTKQQYGIWGGANERKLRRIREARSREARAVEHPAGPGGASSPGPDGATSAA